MWLEIAWKGRVWDVKSFGCHTKEFVFTLGITNDYQRLINGEVIIMRFTVYFVISFKITLKIIQIVIENLKI